jgi:hypothetical protein
MKTNELIYKCSKEVNNTVVYVTIRLNDECKNGCNDFSITGSVYKKGKPKTDKNMIRYGCCHEDILEAFPEFKMFVDLHLCSSDGYPSFLGKNAAYWISIGEDEKAMRDLRCDSDMYDKLYPYYIDNLLFKKAISDYGMLDIWGEQAKKAIAYLEKLTGNEFIDDKHVPFFSEKEIELIEGGSVTLEAVLQKRESEKQEKRIKQIAEIERKYSEQIEGAELEKKVRLLMLDFKGDNWIWYNHSNTLCFNWKSYERNVTKQEVEDFMKERNVVIDFNIEFK